MHSKWRVEPDYLTEEDKQLVKTAREYLIGNPTGTFNQLAAVPKFGIDSIDTQRLQELRKKVKRVIADRNQSKNDIDTVLDRVSELQELKAEMKRMDLALEALASIKSAYTEVLRLRYIEGLPVNEIAQKMFINRRTAHWQMRL
nr:ECF-type sigma factor [Paenibacillus roseus]